MTLLPSRLRRQSSRNAACAGIAMIALAVYGCGGSSNSSNGNMSVSSNTTTTTGTTGGTGSGSGLNAGGFWTVPPGTPLANAALPTGSWQGYIATDTSGSAALTVSSSGAQLILNCGPAAQFSQPIMLDKTGSFVAQGTGSLSSSGTSIIYLSGQVAVSTVNGKSTTNMLLYVGDAPSNAA